MNKSELQAILKPLIKECIKDLLFEEGFLSKIVTEVAIGLNGREILSEETEVKKFKKNPGLPSDVLRKALESKEAIKEVAENKRKSLEERMGKLASASGYSNVFDGIKAEDIEQETRSNEPQKLSENTFDKSGTALRDVDPRDPGVNISGILNVVGGKETWKKRLPDKK